MVALVRRRVSDMVDSTMFDVAHKDAKTQNDGGGILGLMRAKVPRRWSTVRGFFVDVWLSEASHRAKTPWQSIASSKSAPNQKIPGHKNLHTHFYAMGRVDQHVDQHC